MPCAAIRCSSSRSGTVLAPRVHLRRLRRQSAPPARGHAARHRLRRYLRQYPADQAEFISTPGLHQERGRERRPDDASGRRSSTARRSSASTASRRRPAALRRASAKTREIAAWWLRRRVFGVFGPGEVYEQTLRHPGERPEPCAAPTPPRPSGEFLAGPGRAGLLAGPAADGDARVRAASAEALGRLNNDGGGALGPRCATATRA